MKTLWPKLASGLIALWSAAAVVAPAQAGTMFLGGYPSSLMVIDEAKGSVMQEVGLKTGLPMSMRLSDDQKLLYATTITTSGIEVMGRSGALQNVWEGQITVADLTAPDYTLEVSPNTPQTIQPGGSIAGELLRRVIGLGEIVQGELAHAFFAVDDQKDRGHERDQRLVGADIRGSLLPPDVLLAGGEGEHKTPAPVLVDGLAHQSAGHLPRQIAARGEQPHRRAARAWRDRRPWRRGHRAWRRGRPRRERR